jgi:hypothetical protein
MIFDMKLPNNQMQKTGAEAEFFSEIYACF